MKKNLFTLCMMLLLSMLSFAQGSLTISGVVTEKKTGEPIIGASILLKGQSSGTITDFNGNYSIPNVPSGTTLVFSYRKFLYHLFSSSILHHCYLYCNTLSFFIFF